MAANILLRSVFLLLPRRICCRLLHPPAVRFFSAGSFLFLSRPIIIVVYALNASCTHVYSLTHASCLLRALLWSCLLLLLHLAGAALCMCR